MNDQRNKGKIPLLILAGPTAAGKSALAINLARKLNTEIISADSAQVYRGLNIGTAKPSLEEQKVVKHHLIDHADPDQHFSAADYQKAADAKIEQLWYSNKLPFMVGGSGLYIKAVTDRYAFGPQGANPELRAAFEKQTSSNEGLDLLYRKLKTVDPQAAENINPRDRKRIIRAIEVYTLEGKPISEQVDKTKRQESPYDLFYFALYMDRGILYTRIERRVEVMVEQGFLNEVRSLIRQGYDHNSPGMQILGYRQLLNYLQGNMDWDETIAEIKKQTRNLAKRQLTWFRREKDVQWAEIKNQTSYYDIAENIYLKVKDIAP